MIENQIKEIVIRELKISPADYRPELSVNDTPQWDSLAHMNLLMAVEKTFEISFDITDSIEIETIEDLINITQSYLEK